MTNKTTSKFSPEVRARAVRMVLEHEGDQDSQRAAIASIATKIGCTGETIRLWLKRADDSGRVGSAPQDMSGNTSDTGSKSSNPILADYFRQQRGG